MNVLVFNLSLSIKFSSIFLLIIGSLFINSGYAGPFDSYKKQEKKEQFLRKCTWENAQYEDPMFTEKKLLNLSPYTHGYVYSYRYCVTPQGILKIGKTLSGMNRPLSPYLKRYDIGQVNLNKPYRAIEEGKVMVNEWRIEEDKLIKYQCPGDKYNTQLECIGKSIKSIKGVKFERDYLKLGLQKIRQNNYQGAIKDFNQLISKNKGDSNIYYYRGFAKENLGNYLEAIADQNKSIEMNPKNSGPFNSRASANYKLGNYEEAIADYNKAIEIDPKDKFNNSYRNRANANYFLGNYKEAIADNSKAISLYPKSVNAYINRGASKHKLNNYRGAIADYTKVIEIDSKNAIAYANRCESNYLLGNLKSALLDCNMALKINSSISRAYYFRGSINLALDNKKEACDDFKKAGENKEAREYLTSNEGGWCLDMDNSV